VFLILEGFNLLRMLLYFALLLNTEKTVVRIRLGRCSKNLPAHYSQIWPLPRHPPTRPALSLSLYIAQPFSLPPKTHLYTVTHTLSIPLRLYPNCFPTIFSFLSTTHTPEKHSFHFSHEKNSSLSTNSPN
jgi:hypothetical protein